MSRRPDRNLHFTMVVICVAIWILAMGVLSLLPDRTFAPLFGDRDERAPYTHPTPKETHR